MTMRNPLDGEIQMTMPKFDAAKRYRYTWPGQSPAVVSGEEMIALCKGADPSMLSIEEVDSAAHLAIPVPSTSRRDYDK